MSDQPEPTEGTNEDALWLGTGLLVGGAIIFLVATRMLDFMSFGSKEPISYADLGSFSFMTYVWLGLMIGGAIGYQKRRGNELARGVVWRYRAAVWLGTIYTISFGISLLSWWFQPAVAIKYSWEGIARQHGLSANVNLLSTEDFQPLADTITFYWLGNTAMLIGLVMLAIGVWVIRQCRKEFMAALPESG